MNRPVLSATGNLTCHCVRLRRGGELIFQKNL